MTMAHAMGGMSNPLKKLHACTAQFPTSPTELLAMCSPPPLEPRPVKRLNAPPPSDGPFYLRLCVLSGTDIAAGDISGYSDPYVELHFAGERYATSACSRTLNPVWDFLIELEIPESGIMMLKVFDQDFGGQGELLGTAQLHVSKQTKRIKREVLQMQNVPAGWLSKPPNNCRHAREPA